MSKCPLEKENNKSDKNSNITSNQNKEDRVFNTKLCFDIPINSGSNISSPHLNNTNLSNSASVHNYLPDDLIKKLENISPSTSPIEKTNILSSKVSDIETVSNKSDDSSYDDIQLIQYDDFKYTKPSNIDLNSNEVNNNNLYDNNICSNNQNNYNKVINNNINTVNQNNINPININQSNVNNQNNINQNNIIQNNVIQNKNFDNNSGPNYVNQNLIPFNNEHNILISNFNLMNNTTFNPLSNVNVYIQNFPQNQSINNWIINNQILQMNNNINNNINNNNQKPKKKKSKKKPKPFDDYTLEMFGRRGWICEQCNNFNYESRNKCNRCGIPKKPKKIIRNKIKNENGEIIENIVRSEHKDDWYCFNCKNKNYSFRLNCNRCQMKKGDSEKLYENMNN